MTTQELENASVEQLVEKLIAQLNGPLDKREGALIERIGNIVDAKIKAQRDEDERRRAQFVIPGVGKEEARAFSFGELLKGMITKDFTGCRYEVDLCNEAAKKKDMVAGTDSAGGFLVPAQVMQEQLIPLLQAEAIAFKMGVTLLTDLVGSPVPINRVKSGTTAYWVSEVPTTITTSDVSLGQIELTPHTLAVHSKMSNRLIRMSTPAANQLVLRQMRRDCSLAFDAAIFNGTGVSNQPTGVLQTNGISTVTSFGAASANTAYDKLIDIQYKLKLANAMMGGLAYAMHPAVTREFQKMKDPTDASQPKERRLFSEKPIQQVLLNYPFYESTQLPTNDIVFGDWSQVLIGLWGGMLIKTSDVAGTNFERLQTSILICMDADVGVAQPAAFCNTTGMTGAS